jgi:hypothetical protein
MLGKGMPEILALAMTNSLHNLTTSQEMGSIQYSATKELGNKIIFFKFGPDIRDFVFYYILISSRSC